MLVTDEVPTQPAHLSPLAALYAANLLLAFHIFTAVYINSSFLASYVGEELVGLVYIAGSLVSMLSFILIPKMLRLLGNYRLVLLCTLAEMGIFGLLSLTGSALPAILLFIGYLTVFPLLLFSLDIFLEAYTKQESETGGTRGTFLTISNTALIIAPLVAGLLLGGGDYYKVFLLSFLFLIPFFFIILFRFRHFQDPTYKRIDILPTLACIRAEKNIAYIFAAHFLMRFFFSWMVIYMPIYLHQHVGFAWSEIGLMFTIMLLPFALVELPAGKIADGILGEKELLAGGFVIMALATLAIPFVTTAHFLLFAGLLFLTRVGASLVEIMTESYFFKQVNGDDANTISCFRMIRPLAYIVGPLVASMALLFIDLRFLFLLLGLIILSGLWVSFSLKDTK